MKAPNYTQTPNELIDIYMRDMSGSEFKVVMAVVRLTIGWHARYTEATGDQIAALTGLSPDSVKDAAEMAVSRGLIVRQPGHGAQKTVWSIAIDEADIKAWEGVFSREGVFSPPSLFFTPSQGGEITPSPERKPRKSLSIKERVKKSEAPRPTWVDLYHTAFSRYPRKETWQTVADELGADFDRERFGAICREWVLRGYNPANVAGILSVYRDGWREPQTRATGNGNGSAHATPAARPLDIVRIYKD